jgi:hypothetical protein
MKFHIDECHFKNAQDEYLDIEANYLENYITIRTTTTGEFTFENELEIDVLCQKLKEILKAVNGDSTKEIDCRIPGVGC